MARLFSEIRGLLTANDMTQPQLGRRIGLASDAINKKLNGHSPFTMPEAYGILDVFGVPHERLHEVFPPVPSAKARRAG